MSNKYPSVSDMPISLPKSLIALYLVFIFLMGVLSGSMMGAVAVAITSAFSFQFWTYCVWRGLNRTELEARD